MLPYRRYCDTVKQKHGIIMNKLDSIILNILQENFPLDEKPYDILANRLRIPAELLLERIQRMCEDGLIRRIGVSLDSAKFGFVSTLAAISVPADQVEKAAKVIGGFSEVTHNYLRKDVFNIWF